MSFYRRYVYPCAYFRPTTPESLTAIGKAGGRWPIALVLLVSAANNVPAASYPSLFASVFSVAAHGEPDPMRLYYNPAPPVEFGAWGVDVPIAWKDGGSTVATGNSFAAPHVAGMVALILSKHPGLTPFEVKAVLAAIADNPRRATPVHPNGPGEGR